MNLVRHEVSRIVRSCSSGNCFSQDDLLVNLVHAGVARVSSETGHTNLRAAEEATKELVEVSQELAVFVVSTSRPFVRRFTRGIYYWLEVMSLAGMFFIRGAAPPPSRKFLATPMLPPSLVEARPPSK